MAQGKKSDDIDPTSLGARLRALREAAGLSQPRAVAATQPYVTTPRSGTSQATLSRIETGVSLPTPAQVRALLAAYGVTGPAAAALITEVDELSTEHVDARVVLQAGKAHNFQRRVRLAEAESKLVRSYHPTTVLGILQTREYIEAVFAPDDDLSPEDAAASVLERVSRQGNLRDEARKWHLIQTEWALRAPVHSYALQAAQVEYIADVSTYPNVRLGIVPLDTVIADPGPITGFHLYDDDQAIVGTDSGTALLTDPGRVQAYASWFSRLEARAVYGDEARRLLRRIADQYRSLG